MQRRGRRTLALLLAIATLPATAAAIGPPGTPALNGAPWAAWASETAVEQTTGPYLSLALDSTGTPHILTNTHDCNLCPGQTEVATRTQNAWTHDRIPPQAPYTAGRPGAIAIDSSDVIHATYTAYSSGGTYTFNYATRTPTGWVQEVIQPGSIARSHLVFDRQGFPHASYEANRTLHYATRNMTSGTWNVEIIDTSLDAGFTNGLAFDSQNRAHIFYETACGFNCLIREATRQLNGSWTIEDSTLPCAGIVDLAIDSHDREHYACRTASMFGLTYGLRDGANLTSVLVEKTRVNTFPSITVDNQDRPHISYYNGQLAYATQTANGWITEIADRIADSAGDSSSIATDANGTPHIAYWVFDGPDRISGQETHYATPLTTWATNPSTSIAPTLPNPGPTPDPGSPGASTCNPTTRAACAYLAPTNGLATLGLSYDECKRSYVAASLPPTGANQTLTNPAPTCGKTATIPNGPPTLGADEDGDHVPANATIPMTRIGTDGNQTSAPPLIVPLDANDHDATNTQPRWNAARCGPTCARASAYENATSANGGTFTATLTCGEIMAFDAWVNGTRYEGAIPGYPCL